MIEKTEFHKLISSGVENPFREETFTTYYYDDNGCLAKEVITDFNFFDLSLQITSEFMRNETCEIEEEIIKTERITSTNFPATFQKRQYFQYPNFDGYVDSILTFERQDTSPFELTHSLVTQYDSKK